MFTWLGGKQASATNLSVLEEVSRPLHSASLPQAAEHWQGLSQDRWRKDADSLAVSDTCNDSYPASESSAVHGAEDTALSLAKHRA